MKELDVPALLRVMHDYFVLHKHKKEDYGVKSIRTIVSELFQIKGEYVTQCIEGMDSPKDQEFFECVSKYLTHKNKESKSNASYTES